MAEWSKATDLSSVIFGCAGSNPADTKLALLAKWLRRPTVNRKIRGSNPLWSFIRIHTAIKNY